MDILLFEVGGQRYGLLAACVKEVLRAVALVPLPKAPAVVEGVINVRGMAVPVLDIRSRFQLPPKPLAPSDHLILARANERLVALRVDRVIDLIRVEAAAVEDAKGVVPGVEYVAWLVKGPQDLVLIHDLATFLSIAEASSLTEAMLQREQDK